MFLNIVLNYILSGKDNKKIHNSTAYGIRFSSEQRQSAAPTPTTWALIGKGKAKRHSFMSI